MASLPKLPAAGLLDPSKPPPTFSERIITLTPVFLTVLATILAGMSSSEMIQAQYQRSLAAQNQSKVGDQWAFFQAKRMRTTIIERSMSLQPMVAAQVDPDVFQKAFGRLHARFQEGEKQADQIHQAVLNSSNNSANSTVKKLLDTARAYVAETEVSIRLLAAALATSEVKGALAFLGTERLPRGEAMPTFDSDIDRGRQAVRDHLPENELELIFLALDENKLRETIRAAEVSAQSFEKAAKKVDQALQEVDGLVKKQARRVHAFHRAVGAVEEITSSLPEPIRPLVSAISHTDAAAERVVSELKDYQVARDDYTARRDGREAENNRDGATLLELQVYKNSANAERHKRRSRNFFYGMLSAQAGVAIASFSLAARHKSGLWSLAGAAGLTAVVFSLYVYLYI